MHPVDRTLVDPSVTDDEIAQALDGAPAPYTGLDVDAQDDDEALAGLMSPVVATIPERIANARRLRDDRVNVGVNRCLATVRGPILRLPAVYPTAAIAGDNAKPWHPITDPASTTVPRGSIGFAFNGGAGHVWLELGGGLVSTTDFHEPGFEGVALRSRTLTWCRAQSWGWGESVNGFDVWPDPAQPAKPQPPDHEFHTWSWERRVTFLRNEARREKADHPGRARQLRAWADRIERNHKASK